MSYDPYFDEAITFVEIAVHEFDYTKHAKGDRLNPFFESFRDKIRAGELDPYKHRHTIALYVFMRLAMRRRLNTDKEGIERAYDELTTTISKCHFSEADENLILIVASWLAGEDDKPFQEAFASNTIDTPHPGVLKVAERFLLAGGASSN